MESPSSYLRRLGGFRSEPEAGDGYGVTPGPGAPAKGGYSLRTLCPLTPSNPAASLPHGEIAGMRGSPQASHPPPGPQQTRLGRALSLRPSLSCQSPAFPPFTSSLSFTPPAGDLGSVDSSSQTQCSSYGSSRPSPDLLPGQALPACPSSQFFKKSLKNKGISLSSRQGLVGLVFRGQVGRKEREWPLCDAWPLRTVDCGLSRPPCPQTSKLAHPSSACHSEPQLTHTPVGGRAPSARGGKPPSPDQHQFIDEDTEAHGGK